MKGLRSEEQMQLLNLLIFESLCEKPRQMKDLDLGRLLALT